MGNHKCWIVTLREGDQIGGAQVRCGEVRACINPGCPNPIKGGAIGAIVVMGGIRYEVCSPGQLLESPEPSNVGGWRLD